MVTEGEIRAKKTSISVIGLGYVGLPVAVAFGNVASVIGFDSDSKKIDAYKNGVDPTKEVGDDIIAKTGILFTDNPLDLRNALFHIVAVPTPILSDKTPDLSLLESACRTLGQNLRSGSIIVFESTVYPGVTENFCSPILEEESGLLCGKDFKVGYSPERINPSDEMHTVENIVKIVSGMDEESCDTIASIYEMVVHAGIYRAPDIRTAEAAKVIENSQRDINIAFANELSLIFGRMGIDTKEVLKAASTKWNFLPFFPGLVGGHCIGIDPYYLAYCAEREGYHPEVILAGRRINDQMGKYVAEQTVKQLAKSGRKIKNARVGILGLTFKENCPDIRNTRVIDIIDELEEYGINPIVSDSIADRDEAKNLYGITLSPIENFQNLDAVVIAVAHISYRGINAAEMLCDGGAIIDVKGILAPQDGYTYWRL